jgi:predicted O-methyltransferase YrrM
LEIVALQPPPYPAALFAKLTKLRTLPSSSASICNRYVFEKRQALFRDGRGGRRVLELGAGLGLCGILASELNPHGIVVITDGDELAMEKVRCAGIPPPDMS